MRRTLSEETRRKIAEANRGKRRSQEQRYRLSVAVQAALRKKKAATGSVRGAW